MKTLSLLVSSLLIASAVAHAQPSGALVSAAFDNSPVLAGSAASNPKVTGRITFEEGAHGTAATFDGSTWIELPDSPALRPEQWTIAAWVAPQQDQCGGRVIEKGASNSFWLVFQRGRACVGFWNAGEGYQEIASASALKANEWRHVAGSFDGSTLRIYVDGALEGMKKTVGKPNMNKQPLAIGAKYEGVAGDRLLGALDELAFYNRALSDSEIRALFGNGAN
ncbi:MAG: LamG domain-containing protein [Terrimicrobiaceae bacterium]